MSVTTTRVALTGNIPWPRIPISRGLETQYPVALKPSNTQWLAHEPFGVGPNQTVISKRRYDATSTVFCTQYPQKDWHQRLGSGVHADAIMDRIVHNTIWIETGGTNMREHVANTA